MTTPRRLYSDDEVRTALKESGTVAGAARTLGCDERNLRRRIKRMEAAEARQGYAPEHGMTRRVPDGYLVKGVSTLYGADGTISQQWVKSHIDSERQRALLQGAIEALASEIPRERKVEPPRGGDADLLNCYVVTDYHLGQYSWHEEAGADWDSQIAEDLLVGWFAAAIRSAPDAETGVLAQLGDFLHYDGLEAVTPTSKHLLDADTRFQLVVRVAIRAIRRVIRLLLQKHRRVHVIMAEGNHDLASSAWLRELMAALYEDEPRVTVDTRADAYYVYEHGQTSLFFHHGHKRKPTNIDDVFVAKFREIFGRTKHSYAHMGHMHHISAQETNLMVVEQHRTLAAPDAYAARGGWSAGRSASVITYHRQYGEVGRVTISPEMVGAA